MTATRIVPAESKIDVFLDSLLTEVQQLIPESDRAKIAHQDQPVKFEYQSFNAIIEDQKNYSINAACALYNALFIIKTKKLCEKSLFELARSGTSRTLAQQHLWTLDSICFVLFAPESGLTASPFEIVKLSEKEFAVWSADADLPAKLKIEPVQEKTFIEKKLLPIREYKIKYKNHKGKEVTKTLKADHSWIPYVVNEATQKLAKIMKKLADFIDGNKEISEAVRNDKNFRELILACKFILPGRQDYFARHPEIERNDKVGYIAQA